ncbi:LysM peptidoglycan-binding domain-containing protein [Ferruginibacter sp. HRS2-29]|uniref:LysM peptidoglycan-binding domain-containing protein n=1 Tax=Ferruginibacter sp. HRS2-29 TaxID=2487334 RepID=UPI0020CDF585|nr:LysM peptidoglycan-binding domain-containing protein [Ferruginibacter sp. HRS2-29]MCP9753231.1 LysM peptidoglycan-binding domain-containing protein [Ferruginibacter sp. HRS2-29]
MKKILILLFFAPLFSLAQGKYITHTVAAKESLSSIGRLYNINPRELAKYNKIDYEKGLALGQVLKVPVTANTKVNAKGNNPVAEIKTPVAETKASVKNPVASAKGSTPIYHTVAKKETLYHISTLYNKVPIANIKKWNNLSGDGLNEGARLIVGYTDGPNETNTPAPVVKVPEPTKVPDVVKTEPVKAVETNTPVVKTTETKPVATSVTGKDFEGGSFKAMYTKAPGKSEETGTAGIFKSTSGWEDGKYYCMHNSATAGSIVKITNPATNKSVYARVLDIMPDLKQNDNLTILVSNAAADALGAGSGNFQCTVTY